MKARAAVAAALLLALTGPLTACSHEAPQGLDVLVPPGATAASEPSATPTANVTTLVPLRTGPVAGAEWLGWRPTYRDVRRADPAALAELGNRVTSRNASQWTATDPLRGLELAFTPTHARARVPRAALYFRLRPGGPRHSYVVCSETECVDGGRDSVVAGPEASNDYLLRMATYVQAVIAEQTRTSVLHRNGPTRLATVRSPAGQLDCVVHADPDVLAALDGTRVGAAGEMTRCVDANGLLVPLDLRLPFGGWSVADGVTGVLKVPKAGVGFYDGSD